MSARILNPETFAHDIEAFVTAPSTPARSTPPADGAAGMPAAATLQGAPTAESRAIVARRILVVDSSPTDGKLAQSLLEPLGYRLEVATDAGSALAHVRLHPPDLILCDLQLPGGESFGFISLLKADARLRRIPFVFMSSAVCGEDDRRRGLALGADEFVLRPSDPQRLAGEITRRMAGGSR
jgi:CheY-like chemotaxis protein